MWQEVSDVNGVVEMSREMSGKVRLTGAQLLALVEGLEDESEFRVCGVSEARANGGDARWRTHRVCVCVSE